ncbi:serine peptidase [Streptomyces sp. NPDC006290]|uniref:serine peptidase n=1 Tax=Streptomyces sp. NPDC006290 TaxID=3156745 RepID=UPI0033B44044
MKQHDVVMVHGVRNWRPGVAADEAAAELAQDWAGRLAAGYRDGGLGHMTPPRVHAAYYADLLNDDEEEQSALHELDDLGPAETELLMSWLRAAGLPEEPSEGQAWGTMPIRQALDWFARRGGTSADLLARIAVALLPEVYKYLSSPTRRTAARQVVAEAIQTSGARVVVAHSLGSIVAYEALHAFPLPQIDFLLTLGSPLGLPGGVFESLDPAPRNGRGSRPPGLTRWVNIADPGDLVAVPRRLGDRFDVDSHHEAHMAAIDFHTMGSYLNCGLTAAALAPHLF